MDFLCGRLMSSMCSMLLTMLDWVSVMSLFHWGAFILILMTTFSIPTPICFLSLDELPDFFYPIQHLYTIVFCISRFCIVWRLKMELFTQLDGVAILLALVCSALDNPEIERTETSISFTSSTLSPAATLPRPHILYSTIG